MKRFKDISNLSDINTGDKVNALSPKDVYSQVVPPGRRRYTPSRTPSAPAPPFNPATLTVKLPQNFKKRLQEAIDIFEGVIQIDEKEGAKASAWIGALSLAATQIPQLKMLGSAVANIAEVAIAANAASALINLAKPGLRGLVARNIWSLPELKGFKDKPYSIDVYQMGKNPATDTLMPVGTPLRTESMTLEQIFNMLSESETKVKTNYWENSAEGYAFKNPADATNISEMLRRNDVSNKIDAKISASLPFVGPAALGGVLLLNMRGNEKSTESAGEDVKRQYRGILTKPTPEEQKTMDQLIQDKLKKSDAKYGPRKK